MMLIRLKTRHFRKKKIYNADTKSLIFQGYGIAGCPLDLTICRFTSNNFNYSLLVAPFANSLFAKGLFATTNSLLQTAETYLYSQ